MGTITSGFSDVRLTSAEEFQIFDGVMSSIGLMWREEKGLLLTAG